MICDANRRRRKIAKKNKNKNKKDKEEITREIKYAEVNEGTREETEGIRAGPPRRSPPTK
jgi:hypothetical protein